MPACLQTSVYAEADLQVSFLPAGSVAGAMDELYDPLLEPGVRSARLELVEPRRLRFAAELRGLQGEVLGCVPLWDPDGISLSSRVIQGPESGWVGLFAR